MKITNKTGLPLPIVESLSQDSYSRGESNRSITQLIDSPRVRILRMEHQDKLETDASEMVWAALGNAVHLMFEQAAKADNHISEQRLYLKHESGWTISGAIDLQIVNADGSISICDYKCTSVWSVIFGKKEWETQLNGYAWLLRHAKGVPVRELKIVAVLRDWNWRDAQLKPDYPQAPLIEVNIPLWLDDFQDEYFDGRIALHKEAERSRMFGEQIPHCSDDERWAKGPSFAVKKGANKKAVRVLASAREAEDYIKQKNEKGLWVEERQGEATRCSRNYCGVADFCEQYAATRTNDSEVN